MNVGKSKEDYFIGGGNQDNGSKGSNFLCGLNNVIPNSNARSGIYLYGQNLHISKSATGPQHLVVLGRGSNTNINVPSTKSSLGAAITGGGSTNFNIECYPTYTKLNLPIELQSDTTQVNAITPYIDPDNPTADDLTLVTKSYRRGLPAQLTNDLVNNQSTSIANGATINLETGFSITFPTWTELIKIGITNSGGYMDYITMAADVNKSYVSVTGAGTIDVYSYNASTKDFTFVSGGSSASILSIRAEGKTTI